MGICIHGYAGVSKSVCGIVAVGIESLASNRAGTTIMYISFQGQKAIYSVLLQAVEHLILALALFGLD